MIDPRRAPGPTKAPASPFAHAPAHAPAFAFALALAFAFAPAHADAPLQGLQSELPAPLGHRCATLADVQLARPAAAVRAAYLPMKLLTATIQGIQFTDDARALDVLRRALGKTPPSTWLRAKGCTTVLCALRNTLDNELESALWILAIGAEADGVPSLDQSWNRGASDSLWKPEELRILGKTIHDLPSALKRDTNWKVTRRMPDGANWFNNANTWSERFDESRGDQTFAMWLRDSLWKLPSRAIREAITHEAGHQLDFAKATKDIPYPISHSQKWLVLSGWEKVSDPKLREAYRLPRYGPDLDSTSEPAFASEDLADAIVDYRYRPRLMKAYSHSKYEFVKQLLGGVEVGVPAKNPLLDTVIKRLGGRLSAMIQCVGSVQRAFRRPYSPQSQLTLWRPAKNGLAPASNTVFRSAFVDRSACLATTLATIRLQPEWRDLTCRAEPEDLEFQVAERLESVWGAYTEAAALIQATLPPNNAGTCLQKGAFTLNCLAGPRGFQLALSEARRLIVEFDRPRESAQRLARQLAAQSVLLPPDEELFARFPVLRDPRELVTGCLMGLAEITAKPGVEAWTYWARLPRKNSVRGFSNPVYTPACNRDFAAQLKLRGLNFDSTEPLLDHFSSLLKNQAGPFLNRFNVDILQQWHGLASACRIPPGGKSAEADQSCVIAWLLPRVQSFAAPGTDRQLAATLAQLLRGP